MRSDFLATFILAVGPAAASIIPYTPTVGRVKRAEPTAGCLNDDSRLCWDGTYNINTNYYSDGPRTGNVVEYNFEVRNLTLAPDGRERQVLAVNGQIPGPTVVANWGDTVRVTFTNAMQHNGTSIHWHGIRMLNNFINDGVNGVTECPVAPGESKTYEFIAEQYGTSWYHSHYSAQYGDGVFGAIQINGPASEEYDIDLGPITISDWFAFETAYQKAYHAERTGPPVPDNFLVNGTNVNPSDTTQGERFKLTFTPGKKHRLRIINSSVDTFFRFAVDGHTMTVIQTDFNPIKSFQAQTIGIAIGQRYDVIIEADQDASASYWIRTWAQSTCNRNTNDGSGTANAYITYDGGSTDLPSSDPFEFTDNCNDETNLVPYVPITVDSSGWSANETELDVSAPFGVVQGDETVFRWTIGGAVPMAVNLSYPTVAQLSNGDSLSQSLNSFYIDGSGEITAYWLLQNLGPIAHPIHLHLHDFNIIAQGSGTFNVSSTTLNWDNPPRRDVAQLPAGGYLLIAFKADNPGVGIMHCHIAWHVSEGLSLELIERASEIDYSAMDSDWQDTCTTWANWYDSSENPYGAITDSGLRRRHNRRRLH
ncbi:laccase [Auriculariales sp. MPI-PUGE-AT-0066]|nr:laccase [Auriculariales sp. MPI-PUGE-AT-0066]